MCFWFNCGLSGGVSTIQQPVIILVSNEGFIPRGLLPAVEKQGGFTTQVMFEIGSVLISSQKQGMETIRINI